MIKGLCLQLAHRLDTHIHADHITAALGLKKRTGTSMA
jgi:glyoxylase-like metal-dependent hydrolase (beta-lactamase superfamily II)